MQQTARLTPLFVSQTAWGWDAKAALLHQRLLVLALSEMLPPPLPPLLQLLVQ